MLSKILIVFCIVKPQRTDLILIKVKPCFYAIRNKLIYILIELKDFEFVTTLVLEFKKIESDDKTKNSTFYLNLKEETIINETDDDDYFDQSIVLLYQRYKNL